MLYKSSGVCLFAIISGAGDFFLVRGLIVISDKDITLPLALGPEGLPRSSWFKSVSGIIILRCSPLRLYFRLLGRRA